MNLQTLIAKSRARLEDGGIHPVVREKAYKLIEEAHKVGINVVITQGFRTKAYQDSLYAQGRTAPGSIVTNVKGGYSYHNYGLAVDFAILNANGSAVIWDTSVDLNKNKVKDWTEVGKIGERLGFEWGGSWKNFVDMPHLQMTFGLTINQLLAGKRPPQPTVAAKPQQTSPVHKPDTPCNVIVNGKTLSIKGFLDGADDRSYLPVRIIGQTVGVAVDYQNNKIILSGKPLGTSRVVGDTGYAHSREIAEVLNYNVEWVSNPPTVKLNKKG